jgi:hypothetical protein
MTFPAQLISFISSQQDQTSVFNKFNTDADGGVGRTSFTVPPGVTVMSAVCIGGGGGGSGSQNDERGSAGGGGGGVSWAVFSVIPGDVFNIQIGYGGAAGAQTQTGNGGDGTTSSIELFSRPNVGNVEQLIMQASGGLGGRRSTIDAGTGIGGAGGSGAISTPNPYNTTFLSGGGTGGRGGFSNNIGCGGGGAAGYSGNGGNGGDSTNAPQAAAGNSGGGGGGGNSSTLGYGGGGTGGYGFSGTGQGAAGINGSAGGGGGSYFNDPGLGLVALKVGEEIAVSGPGITTIAVPNGTQSGDFLLLLSASDKDSGLTSMPVPVGFTTFNRSERGVYYTTNQNYATGGGIGTEAIAANLTANGATDNGQYQQKDLNFANSFLYAPADFDDNFSIVGGRYCVTGLTTYPAIHNLISLRYIPGSNANPASIQWAASSGDPSWNATNGGITASSMPNPPAVSGVAAGSLSIALGYLANTVLNPSNQVAPTGYNLVGVSAHPNNPPQTSSIMAAYKNNNAANTPINPEAFLTGTASHSRAYTIQLNRTNSGTAIQFVGYATATTPTTSINLNTLIQSGGIGGIANNDLVIVATVSDNPNGGVAPGAPSFDGGTMTVLQSGSSPDNRQTTGVTPGMAYGVWYDTSYGGGSTNITGLYDGGTGSPSSHIAMVFRGATIQTGAGNTVNFTAYDSNIDLIVQAPDPPELFTLNTVASNNNTIVTIGMTDDVKIANVTDITPPANGYDLLAAQSYGQQNNGVIIMTGIKFGLVNAIEDPDPFVGNGANIWASQTIVIGGPGSDTGGVQGTGGQYGGGGGSRDEDISGIGGEGAAGAVRLIWGTARQYPSANQGDAPVVDWTP